MVTLEHLSTVLDLWILIFATAQRKISETMMCTVFSAELAKSPASSDRITSQEGSLLDARWSSKNAISL